MVRFESPTAPILRIPLTAREVDFGSLWGLMDGYRAVPSVWGFLRNIATHWSGSVLCITGIGCL
jgi:hypothetical protein